MHITVGLCFEKPSIHKYLYVYDTSENVDMVKEWLKCQFELDFICEINYVLKEKWKCRFYTKKIEKTDKYLGCATGIIYENLITIESKDIYIVYDQGFKVYSSEEFNEKFDVQSRNGI